MTGILIFESDHGPVSIEVDEAVARSAGGQAAASDLVAKGVVPLSADGGEDIVARAGKRFGDAMATLRAYTANLQDLIADLDQTPKEVSVEVGLKMSGSAGFIIAKAGASAEMKIALKWEPKPKADETG